MTDLRVLHDAFAELERRADAVPRPTVPQAASPQPALPLPALPRLTRPRRALRLVPVAATVIAVSALAGGAVWLAPQDSGTQAGQSTNAPGPLPTPEQVTNRFAAALGDMATFEVTDTVEDRELTEISGTLTADGVTGDFRVEFRRDKPLAAAIGCEIASTRPECVPNSSTTRAETPLAATAPCELTPTGPECASHAGGVHHRNGLRLLVSVGGRHAGDELPLTNDQFGEVLHSPLWW